MYGGAADDWPIGRTPPEVQEKRKAQLMALEEFEDNSNVNDSNIASRVDSGETVPGRPPQTGWLPTPLESPPTTSHSGKRRRISEGNKQETHTAKTHVSTGKEIATEEVSAIAECGAHSAFQRKGRKRRRALNRVDEEEGRTTRPGNIWLQRLRPRRLKPLAS